MQQNATIDSSLHKVKFLNKRFFGLFMLMMFSIFLLAKGINVAKADDRVFQSSILTVKEKSESEVDAKKKALRSARKIAFKNLVERLVPKNMQPNVTIPEDKVLENLVYTTNIVRERMSQGQGLYIGDIQLGFRPDLIREMFIQKGVSFSETPSQKLLILPILENDNETLLWEDHNNWRLQWALSEFKENLVPVTQAFGDLADISVITTAQAIEEDPVALKNIAQKYGASGAFLTFARHNFDASTARSILSTKSIVFANGWENDAIILDFKGDIGEDLSSIYTRAVPKIYSALQEFWKAKHLIEPAAQNKELVMNMEISGLGDWVKLRSALETTAMVTTYELINISVKKALVKIKFSGRLPVLKSALAQKKFDLNFDEAKQAWHVAPFKS